ncbi:MAG: large conductance mechanosensitive channel [Yoonia sp.]|jgi:large conductance mechanosensitive channel
MLKEFKDFIAKGNVMDMAVGIIIGAAFTAIVGSLVADMINPLIGLFMGGVDFAGLSGSVGVSETLCMRLSPCEFDGSLVEPFWI